MTVPVFFYIVLLIPQASIRFFVWLLSLTIYRVRVFGRENLPREGGALLVPNHVTLGRWHPADAHQLAADSHGRLGAEYRNAPVDQVAGRRCSARSRSIR